MFTGLIEAVGEVLDLKPLGSGYRLRLACDLADEMAAGDSLAVNGVCLTMVGVAGGELHADVGPETVRVTNIGALVPGSLVNLERPLRADARLGGHFVMGHVDGTGTIEEIREDKEFWWVKVAFPQALAPYIIHKGSIAIDGISLTAAVLGDGVLDVMIIPYTLDHTNLRAARRHDRVNIECDMIGKYVVRLAELGAVGGGVAGRVPGGGEASS